MSRPRRISRGETTEPRSLPPADNHPEHDSGRREQHVLSFDQRRMWFLDRLDPNGAAYLIPQAVRFHGPLDVGALQGAHDALAARHEILRTRYPDIGGVPVPVIEPPGPAPFRLVDFSQQADSEREANLERAINAESLRPFDLSSGPVWRIVLFRRDPEDHVLLTVIHHIAVDGWSMPLLRQEIAEGYRAGVTGTPPKLPPLPVQYRDYAERQIRSAAAGAFDTGLDFWKGKLGSDPPPLDLPTDRLRPPVQTARGGWIEFTIPGRSMSDLEQLAVEFRVTPMMLGLAIFAGFLSRYTASDDLTIGVPSAERTWDPAQGLIGLFVNTLPIRVAGHGGLPLRDLAALVRAEVLSALEHRDVPFEEIVHHLQPRRDPSRTPFFQAIFQMRDPTMGGGYGLVGLEEGPVKIHGRAAPVDLTMELWERDQRLVGALNYNVDLFDPSTIERMAEHFGRLAAAALADPDRPVDQLPMLAEWERTWLLRDLNATRRPYPESARIFDVFDRVAAADPDAVAVTDGALAVTYRDLRRAAQAIADQLAAGGLEEGEPVGVRMERSASLVAAMLGILRAGGAYVPLDPGYPSERIEFMTGDSGIRFTVAAGGATWSEVTVTATDRPARPLPLDSTSPPAYVMYTSGSTGTPKGVVVTQRAVLRLVCNTDYVSLGATDVIAHLSNVSFDAATFEIWGALLNGARLLVLDQETILTPSRFADALEGGAVTTMFVTTALFNLMARLRPDAFGSLQTLLFGGEAADPSAVRSVLAGGVPRRLLHVYGPTESTTFAAWHRVETVPSDARTVPIGEPVANSTLYVLGPGLEPVPTGVTGELYIGGDGVASGYIGDAQLTASRFVPDPFSDVPDGRLYRTGDLVRRRPDGAIEFLRRADRQVKLRGFRVEPGEIEAVISLHPRVADRIVLPVSVGDSTQLAAWVVPAAPGAISADEIISHIRSKLPSFMVPSSVQIISELPLNPNSKIDVGQLTVTDNVTEGGKLRTPTERTLGALWQGVLGIPHVARDADFFDLGGHSLLAVELMSSIEEAFGVVLPLSTLFEAPTPAQLAARLDQPPTDLAEDLVPIHSGGNLTPLFCFHPGGGNVFVYEPLARHLGFDRPVFGVQARGVDGRQAPHRTVEEMARAYIDSIRTAQPHGPYLLAGYSSGGLVAYEVARLLNTQGEEVGLLALFDTVLPGRTLPRIRRQDRPRTRIPRALVEEVYRAARRIGGRLRYGPRWRWYLARQRPVPLLLAGKRLTHLGLRAHARYRPQSYAGTITYFAAGSSGSLHARASIAGWQGLAARVDTVPVPGTHAPPERWQPDRPRGPERRSLIEEPHVAVLAAELRRRLDTIGVPSEHVKSPSEYVEK